LGTWNISSSSIKIYAHLVHFLHIFQLVQPIKLVGFHGFTALQMELLFSSNGVFKDLKILSLLS